MRECLFPAVGCGTCFQSLHRWEIYFCDAVERSSPLRGTQHLGRDDLGLARQFVDSHRHMLVLIDLLEGFDVFGALHKNLWKWPIGAGFESSALSLFRRASRSWFVDGSEVFAE